MAFLHFGKKRVPICVLLDSDLNILILYRALVERFVILMVKQERPLRIKHFNRETVNQGASYYTHSLKLEIGQSQHITEVTCNVVDGGVHEMIIPFGWWHDQHPIAHINELKDRPFEDTKYSAHVGTVEVGIDIKWDESVLFTEDVVYVG